MTNGIWDSYINWADLAKKDDFDVIKERVKGNNLWRENYVSPELNQFFTNFITQKQQNSAHDICVVDFGCGLGRNASLLRRFFPRVVAVDIPEMTERLKCLHGDQLSELYDGVYNSFAEAAEAQPIHILYDSVVLQHIIDSSYLTELTRSFLNCPTLDTIISIAYHTTLSPVVNWLIHDHGFNLIHTEEDHKSLGDKHYHTVRVIQKQRVC